MQKLIFAGFTAASLAALFVTATMAGCSTASGVAIATPGTSEVKPIALATVKAEPNLSPQTKAVIERLEEKVAKSPDNVKAQHQLAFAYMQAARETGDLARYVEARTSFEAAVKADPKDPENLHNLGWCLTSFHDFQNAIKYSKMAIEADPKDYFAYGVLFDSYYELGRYDEAADAVQIMVDLRPDMTSYSRAAQLRWIRGDVKGAQWLMGKAITAGGDFTENTLWCRVQLAEMQFKDGSIPSAEQNLLAVLKANPKQAAAMAGLARVRMSQNKNKEAIELYEKSIATAPQMAVVLELAALQTATGDKDGAAKSYEMIPGLIAKHQEFGISGDEIPEATYQLEYKKDIKAAKEIMERDALGHSSVPVYGLLGWIYLQDGKPEMADVTITKAMKVGTQDSLLWYRAAKIKAAVGKKEESVKLALAATSLNSNFAPIYADDARQMTHR